MITNASLPELTESEWAVIKAVWQLEPCPAPTVQEHLAGQRDWSVSTVRTVMERMAAKGLLTSEKLRNLTLYRSAVSRVTRANRDRPGDGPHAGERRHGGHCRSRCGSRCSGMRS